MARSPRRLRQLADEIAASYHHYTAVDDPIVWEEGRDAADIHTGGGLNATGLDILTDMVVARVKEKRE